MNWLEGDLTKYKHPKGEKYQCQRFLPSLVRCPVFYAMETGISSGWMGHLSTDLTYLLSRQESFRKTLTFELLSLALAKAKYGIFQSKYVEKRSSLLVINFKQSLTIINYFKLKNSGHLCIRARTSTASTGLYSKHVIEQGTHVVVM